MAKVLIVDDSPTDQHVLAQALQRHGFTTVLASEGKEAIALAESERPDVILMDIVMPGMNGFQATRHLTKNPATASIPVLIVTSKQQETDRVWGLRQGAVSYITKPVADDDLVAAVKASIKQ
jgi:twitching motility two-component system response regulator PilH